MSVSLIVTKYVDRQFNETGKYISIEDWVAYVDSDDQLSLRDEPVKAVDLDGSVISMTSTDGQSEFVCEGRRILFLGLRSGELLMPYHPEMENPSNPLRKKVSEVARHFDALITHDASDEFFDW